MVAPSLSASSCAAAGGVASATTAEGDVSPENMAPGGEGAAGALLAEASLSDSLAFSTAGGGDSSPSSSAPTRPWLMTRTSTPIVMIEQRRAILYRYSTSSSYFLRHNFVAGTRRSQSPQNFDLQNRAAHLPSGEINALVEQAGFLIRASDENLHKSSIRHHQPRTFLEFAESENKKQAHTCSAASSPLSARSAPLCAAPGSVLVVAPPSLDADAAARLRLTLLPGIRSTEPPLRRPFRFRS